MSSPPPNSLDGPRTPHGGDMDPNEVRLRQAQAQAASASYVHPPSSASPISVSGGPHGGDLDPNEVRLRLAHPQQPLKTPPAASTLGLYQAMGPRGGPQVPRPYVQPTPYGSGSHLISPTSPPYQTAQSPQSVSSGQYNPQHYGPQSSYFSQPQQPQPYYCGSPTTAYPSPPMTSIPPQSSPEVSKAPQSAYEPSQSWSMKQEADRDAEKAAAPSQYHETAERGYGNIFHPRTEWRGKWPNTFQLPSLLRHGEARRHRDVMQRAAHFASEDYYLSPFDGHLAKLFVQCTQPIYDANPNSTWRRTFIRNQSPLMLQVAKWVLHSLPTDDREVKGEDLAMTGLKWIPSCVAIFLLMIYPVQASGEVRNGGKYDPLPYRYWGYPYHAKNVQEARVQLSPQSGDLSAIVRTGDGQVERSTLNPISERPAEPKYLCFLGETEGIQIREVFQWKKEFDAEATYVLVSYTSEHFKTDEEMLFLHEVGELAARGAGVRAYWVGCSCLGKTKEEQESNVWTISDIVRGAHGLVIAVAEPGDLQKPATDSMDLLRQWGTRVWTLPEVLLISSSNAIHVYARNANKSKPLVYHKRNFASLWGDASVARELIDHYEGNLILSPLELVTVALRCLYNRQNGYYLPGDMAYALMGLLRRRPTVVKTDTAFQAFARLSLANDSDLLLERLICILPRTLNQPWYEMEDQWHVSLWDILPTTQICGIADNNTVIIDGAYAASIRWKAFAQVASLTKDSWRRFFFRYGFRSTTYFFIIGLILISNGVASGIDSLTGIGAFLLVIALIFILAAPYIIRILYTGKIWGTQAWFFGFEGYLDIGTIEQHIFGADMGHLKWSTNGSPLSMHAPNEHGECIGQDPTKNPETAEKVKAAINAQMGENRIFTLVDSYTLTVTLFEAVRPPTAVLLCGEEGGMQRALLCSYDWVTQTLCRESVLRMETLVLEQMQRVGRVRLGLRKGKE